MYKCVERVRIIMLLPWLREPSAKRSAVIRNHRLSALAARRVNREHAKALTNLTSSKILR
jgi:hypothetical protein